MRVKGVYEGYRVKEPYWSFEPRLSPVVLRLNSAVVGHAETPATELGTGCVSSLLRGSLPECLISAEF